MQTRTNGCRLIWNFQYFGCFLFLEFLRDLIIGGTTKLVTSLSHVTKLDYQQARWLPKLGILTKSLLKVMCSKQDRVIQIYNMSEKELMGWLCKWHIYKISYPLQNYCNFVLNSGRILSGVFRAKHVDTIMSFMHCHFVV